MNRVIVGMITMPFSLSNKERLLWFDVWLKNSEMGIKHHKVTVEISFTFERDFNDTMKYLMRPGSDWSLLHDAEMITPDGIYVRFMYDPESEELINEYIK